MKSSIKVDYDSIFTGSLGNKEPVIKVKIQDSEDPRDTLIRCIFSPTSKYEILLRNQSKEGDEYVIYSKNRYAQVCQLWENVYNVMIHTLPDASAISMCTSNDELYFDMQGTEKYTRSTGCKREEMNYIPDNEVIKNAVNDFNLFIAVKNTKK